MLLNFSCSVASESFLLRGNQSTNKVDNIFTKIHLGREKQIILVVLDFVIDFLIGLGREGGITN